MTGAFPLAGSEATLKLAREKTASVIPAKQRRSPSKARKLKNAERAEDFGDFFFMCADWRDDFTE